MDKIHAKALEMYPNIYERVYCESYFPNVILGEGFIAGAEWYRDNVWHNVKDEHPKPRKRVLCINHTSAEVKEYLSTNIGDIDMYEKWAYVDDLIPKDF